MDDDALRESIAEVLASECSLAEIHRHVDGRSDLAAVLAPIAGALGWIGLCVDEESGGLGLGDEALCVAAEELGRALAPESLSTLLLVAPLLAEFAPDAVRERYLDRALAGYLSVAVDASLKEGAEVEVSRLLLGGEDADLLVLAIPGRDGEGTELALAERESGAGLASRPSWDRTRRLCALTTDSFELHRLGTEAYGRALRRMALILAADSLGASEAMLSNTVEFLCMREQFGRKLASFQALKHRLADLRIEQTVQRSLIDVASDSAAGGGPALIWPLLCKAEVTDGAAHAAGECLQLHGAMGFTWEHDCHLFLKRARLNQALLAENDVLRLECGNLLPALLRSDEAARQASDVA